jgi:hypothetical protein
VSLTNLNDPGEPLHITATMAALAQLRDTFHLPHPAAVRLTKFNGIAAVEVETFGEVVAWAQALGQCADPISHVHGDGSASHSVWVRWCGWDVRVGAWVNQPPPAVPPRAGCPAGCDDQFADTDCAVHGVVAFVKAVQ